MCEAEFPATVPQVFIILPIHLITDCEDIWHICITREGLVVWEILLMDRDVIFFLRHIIRLIGYHYWQFRITLMRIRISLFTLMWFRNRFWLWCGGGGSDSSWIRIRINVISWIIQLMTLMRIRILPLIKVMRICGHWPAEPPRLHFESTRLQCEPSRPSMAPFWASTAVELLTLILLDAAVDFDADPGFHCDVNPDPASQNDADPDSRVLIILRVFISRACPDNKVWEKYRSSIFALVRR